MGRKTKEVGAMPTCYRITYMLLALFSQLSVLLKLCITNALVHFLLCHSCRMRHSLRNVSLVGPKTVARKFSIEGLCSSAVSLRLCGGIDIIK